jgi:GTP-binding protein HflX
MTRKCILPSGFTALLTDTVGFIEDLPTSLIAAFRSTLEEAKEADLILHIVDSSNPDYFNHEQTVYRLLEELGAENIPMLTVYNKRDNMHNDFVPSSKHDSILISAFNKEDLQKLGQEIQSHMKESMKEYKVFLPNSEGKLLAQLKSNSVLTELSYDEAEDRYMCKGYIQPNLSINEQLRDYLQ